MALDDMKQWRCQNCKQITLGASLLTARSPFDAEDTLTGCPICRRAEGFDEICDEPGCERDASWGFPAGPEFGGYRRTCHAHMTRKAFL